MNRSQALQYLRKAADRCPYCNANGGHIRTALNESDGLDMYQDCSCDECHKEWSERYTLRAVDEHNFRDMRIEVGEISDGINIPRLASWIIINGTSLHIADSPTDMDAPYEIQEFLDEQRRFAEDNFIDFTDIRETDNEHLPNVLTLDEGIERLKGLIPIGMDQEVHEILTRMQPARVELFSGVASCDSEWVIIEDHDTFDEFEEEAGLNDDPA